LVHGGCFYSCVLCRKASGTGSSIPSIQTCYDVSKMEEEQSFEIPVRKLHSKQGRRSRRISGRVSRSVVDYIYIVHATGRTIYLITESISLEIRTRNTGAALPRPLWGE
jgi:hypothetical protein